VRYLLHRVKKPYDLAVAPYAQAICAATGEPNPARALRRLIDEALPGASYAEARLHSLILRMDFDADLTADEAAQESNLSRRHLQRIRSEAVRAIAHRLRELVHLDAAAPAQKSPPAKRPAALDGTQRFRHEYDAFARARERGDTLEMRAIARNIRRIADDSALALALRLQAEAELRLGRLAQAAPLLEEAARLAYERADTTEFAALTLLRAETHFFEGNTSAAEELSAGALRALPELTHEWIAGHVLIARARLARRARWSPSLEAAALRPDSYGGVAFTIVRAQHAAAEQQWAIARELAESSLDRAKASEFEGLYARSAATLSAIARACGDLDGERQWRADALRSLLRTQDYLTACRLFGDACRCDDAAVEAIVDRVRLVVPQTVNDDVEQTAAVRALSAELLARGLDRFRPRALLDRAADCVRDANSAFASYSGFAAAALEEMLTLSLVALAGQHCWSGRHTVLRDALRTMNDAFIECRPAGLLVGYPSTT